jgi:hypothetical protein
MVLRLTFESGSFWTTGEGRKREEKERLVGTADVIKA